MSEMVERVAKAILDAIGKSDSGGMMMTRDYAEGVTYLDGYIRADDIARAAIEAMREPSDEMMVAAEDVAPVLASFAEKQKSPSYLAWQAMIDAALDAGVETATVGSIK